MPAAGRRRLAVCAVVGAVAVAYAGYAVGSAHGGSSGAAVPTSSAAVASHATTPTTAPASKPKRPAPPRKEPRLVKDLSVFPYSISVASWERLLTLAQQAGANVISTDVNWGDVEPDGPARAGEFALLDRFVRAVLARGMEVRFQLVGFPDWARDSGQPDDEDAPWLAPVAPDELARWTAWVSRLARHFRGEISYYEVWNEPNISPFWYPIPEPAQYADLLEATDLAIKAVDPATKVMFAGMSLNDVGFLTQVYASLDQQFPATAKKDHHFFDVLAVHPYSGSRSPELNTPEQIYPDDFGLMNGNFLGFEQLHAVMAANGEADKRVYVTEYGFTTLGFYGFPPISDATRAHYLTEAWSLVVRIPYVIGFSWYCLYPNLPGDVGWAMLQGSGTSWQESLTYKAFAAARL